MFFCNIQIPFQTPFSVVGTEIDTINELKLYYEDYVNFDRPLMDNIIKIEKKNELYLVKYNDFSIETKSPLQSIQDIFFRETTFDDNVCPLHGAAVEYDNKAYLFIASSMAGKSTLVSYLTHFDLKYITDDRIFLNKNNHMIYPVITPIHLRPKGFEILENNGAAPSNYKIVGVGESKRFIFIPHNFSINPLKIKAFFFIKRNDVLNSIRKIEKANVFDGLLKSSSSINQINVDYIRFIKTLSPYPSFELIYKDLFFVLNQVHNL